MANRITVTREGLEAYLKRKNAKSRGPRDGKCYKLLSFTDSMAKVAEYGLLNANGEWQETYLGEHELRVLWRERDGVPRVYLDFESLRRAPKGMRIDKRVFIEYMDDEERPRLDERMLREYLRRLNCCQRFRRAGLRWELAWHTQEKVELVETKTSEAGVRRELITLEPRWLKRGGVWKLKLPLPGDNE